MQPCTHVANPHTVTPTPQISLCIEVGDSGQPALRLRSGAVTWTANVATATPVPPYNMNIEDDGRIRIRDAEGFALASELLEGASLHAASSHAGGPSGTRTYSCTTRQL